MSTKPKYIPPAQNYFPVDKYEWVLNHFYGCCDVCSGGDDSFNIHKDNYGCCTKHKRYWLMGANVESSWKNENEHIWEENKKKYGGYKKISGFEYYEKLYPKVQNSELSF